LRASAQGYLVWSKSSNLRHLLHAGGLPATETERECFATMAFAGDAPVALEQLWHQGLINLLN